MERVTEQPAAEEKHGLPGEGEPEPVEFLEGHKHASLFRWLFHLHDTGENRIGPMKLTAPNELCYPCPTTCKRHDGCAMLQIFSLKLVTANLPQPTAAAASDVEVYGFMAARDLLDPRRNYVFNRSRDDPLVIRRDQLRSGDPCHIHLSGPKRGVNNKAPVLLEYDMKIKIGAEGDVPLIAGVAVFSNKISCRAVTTRISGDRGPAAVEISHARFPTALEATVQVRIIDLDGDLDLSVTGFVPTIPEDVLLFRGVVDGPRELSLFPIAVDSDSILVLRFEARDAAGSRRVGEFEFRPAPHGSITDCGKFDFATVEVHVTWSNLINSPDPDDI